MSEWFDIRKTWPAFAGFEDERQLPAKEFRQLEARSWERQENGICRRTSRNECSPTDTVILAQCDPFRTSHLQMCKTMNLCCFKLLNLGWFVTQRWISTIIIWMVPGVMQCGSIVLTLHCFPITSFGLLIPVKLQSLSQTGPPFSVYWLHIPHPQVKKCSTSNHLRLKGLVLARHPPLPELNNTDQSFPL